ncbi:hypothetical protein OAE59_01170 [Synechococcus sp. AH-551-B05]|nr:hypothetical protein [Synechococcus sp. AH-551-B05]MDB4677232.1 hypothetical protein [Synechococcus sp. AH-551-B05]
MGSDLTSREASAAIQRASEMFGDDALQASHHVDLNSGREGFINDGDPNSYIYKGGKTINGQGEQYANPLEGREPGAKHLEQMSPESYKNFDNIFEQQQIYRQGTGDWAGVGKSPTPFLDKIMGLNA